MGCNQSKSADVAIPADNVTLKTAEPVAVAQKVSPRTEADEEQPQEEDDFVEEAPTVSKPIASVHGAPTIEKASTSPSVDVPDTVRANFSSFNISFIDPTLSAPTSVSTEPSIASSKAAVVSQKEVLSVAESTAAAPFMEKSVHVKSAVELYQKLVADFATGVVLDNVEAEPIIERVNVMEPTLDEVEAKDLVDKKANVDVVAEQEVISVELIVEGAKSEGVAKLSADKIDEPNAIEETEELKLNESIEEVTATNEESVAHNFSDLIAKETATSEINEVKSRELSAVINAGGDFVAASEKFVDQDAESVAFKADEQAVEESIQPESSELAMDESVDILIEKSNDQARGEKKAFDSTKRSNEIQPFELEKASVMIEETAKIEDSAEALEDLKQPNDNFTTVKSVATPSVVDKQMKISTETTPAVQNKSDNRITLDDSV
ncbi:hypothetical protein CCR75_007054 [Bremia lactucae]|uniref:Uncharacterized protein n=1 Tax=Bremia lactucae TaxID=4779 RepID=A0A976FQ59_BRELC|nr:hypothetical protein CCR75_007054 [Bremia lactucae]